jgi:tetratricopeptide (TPR) repeat protein
MALATLVVFVPGIANDFVDWDDDLNFVGNPHYRGLGWSQLRWMFTATVTGHYIPVTWMTLGLDYVLWGMNPAGYHLTNLVLHALNTIVFTLIAIRLLGLARRRTGGATLWAGAATAALFFSLHPLRAETVAWVTERRGLLSAFFTLLTVLTYLRAAAAEGGPRRRWLAASVGCYLLALASKAAVVPLPLVLLVLDVYPLGRLQVRWREWGTSGARAVWLEKVPYALLAVAAAAIALAVNHAEGRSSSIGAHPPSARGAMLSYGLLFYLQKTAMPLGLSPLYELPEHVSPLDPPFLASIIAVALLTGALGGLRRRWPAGLAIWITYTLMLLPVSGLFQTGHQLVADRYSYLSCLPWALLLGAAVCATLDAAASGRLRTPFPALVTGVVALWIGGLAASTWIQVQAWRDSETLWRYALDRDPACVRCYNQLGAGLGNRGDVAWAVHYFERGLELRPNDPGLRGNLGLAFLKTGRPADAIPHFIRALELKSTDVETRVHLGAALILVNRAAEATDQLRQAVGQSPNHARARLELGRAYLVRGHRAAAEEQAAILRRLDPRLADELK